MENNSFNHSVKVPKLFKCAAKISQEVAGGSGSVKQLVYEKKHFNTKALYALVVTAFQKAKEIDLLLKRTKLLEKEPRLDPWLAKILISEVLWGKKQLPKSDAKPIQTILAYEQAFHAHLSDSSGDFTAVNQEKRKKPRYVRINTLINPFNEAMEFFQDEGWTLQKLKDANDYERFLEEASNLEGDFMLKDLHVPDLLIFPVGTEFYNHPGYKKGALVLQDKASCLAVQFLSPPPGSVVLDMCAAPGMKTTQLAAMLQNKGTIYAVERDPKRFEVLKKMVENSGATCIKTINKDVLDCGNSEFPDVEYVLVDPSCSASGMTDRLDVQQARDPSRLQKLAGFQIKILRSALTRYPKVKKIVYSTCSLYPEENEDVVRQVLETNDQFKLVPVDTLLNKPWKNFGSSDFGDIGKFCLYARPEEDLTNGFFVAVFERLEDGGSNQFFNGRVLNYKKNVEQKQARKEKKFNERLEKLKQNEYRRKNDVDVNDLIDQDEINSNTGDQLNKPTDADVDILGQELENGMEVPKKQKKKKRKHDEIKNDIETNYIEITDKDVAEELITNKSSKKDKRKKRKEIGDETEGLNVGSSYDSSGKSLNESKKSKKKKREYAGEESLVQMDDQIDDVATKSLHKIKEDTSPSKTKKKKRSKENKEVDALEQINYNNEKLLNNKGNSDKNDETFKKSKKKKRKRGEDENIRSDGGDELINESLKKSKRKDEKRALDIVENSTYNKEELLGRTNDGFLTKKKTKQRKITAVDNTT